MGRVSMPQGKGSQLHNRRDYDKIGKEMPDNIDVTRTSENITMVDLNIRQAYQDIFGEALEKYNNKQKRADRKIHDYVEHIRNSGNGENVFYEDILQWGSKDDFVNPEIRQKAKDALVEYVQTFPERNPNLKIIGAYIHMDEASPHLHLDYVPVAHGYSRGLETRNSLDKAMKEMGYNPKNENRQNNATKLWKETEKSYFADLCRSRGLEVEAERKSNRKSLSIEEYKEARDEMIGEIEQQRDDLQKEYNDLKQDVDMAKEEAWNYQAVADISKREAKEASELKDKAQDELKDLQGKKTALEADLRRLTGQNEQLQLKNKDLQEEIAGKEAEIRDLQNKTDMVQEHLQQYQELKASVDQIDAIGRTALPGQRLVKTEDLEILKDQAKCYVMNRYDLDHVRELERDVTSRSNQLRSKENDVERLRDQLNKRIETYTEKFNEQYDLNMVLLRTQEENRREKAKVEKLSAEKAALVQKNQALEGQIASLKAEITQKVQEAVEPLKRQIDSLTSRLRGAFETVRNAVMAIGVLKHAKEHYPVYHVEGLTAQQGKLIDGIADYAAEKAKEAGYADIAENIEKHVRISTEIKEKVEPNRMLHRNHGHSHEER